MKIRMVEERTGPRWDGRYWPPRGGEMYVEDGEGADICAAGWAIPVPEELPVELRAAESPAEAPEPPAPAKPSATAPKATWVAWAAEHGMSEDEAAGMSKADLIAALG